MRWQAFALLFAFGIGCAQPDKILANVIVDGAASQGICTINADCQQNQVCAFAGCADADCLTADAGVAASATGRCETSVAQCDSGSGCVVPGGSCVHGFPNPGLGPGPGPGSGPCPDL
jgi:hypothetical protein